MSLTVRGQTLARLASGNPKSCRATSNTKVKRRRGGGREARATTRVRGSAAQIRSETIDLSAEAESFHQTTETDRGEDTHTQKSPRVTLNKCHPHVR